MPVHPFVGNHLTAAALPSPYVASPAGNSKIFPFLSFPLQAGKENGGATGGATGRATGGATGGATGDPAETHPFADGLKLLPNGVHLRTPLEYLELQHPAEH